MQCFSERECLKSQLASCHLEMISPFILTSRNSFRIWEYIDQITKYFIQFVVKSNKYRKFHNTEMDFDSHHQRLYNVSKEVLWTMVPEGLFYTIRWLIDWYSVTSVIDAVISAHSESLFSGAGCANMFNLLDCYV